MATMLQELEETLNKTFGKSARPMPKRLKLFLVQWAHIFSLVAGVLGLFSALALWRWAHASNAYVDFAESTCVRYGGENCGVLGQSRLSFWVWLSLLALILQSILFVAAYTGLKERSKKGWDYLYYGLLVAAVVSILRLFAGYSQFIGFVFALLAAAIGCYVLFQLRDSYLPASSRLAPQATPEPKHTVADEPATAVTAEPHEQAPVSLAKDEPELAHSHKAPAEVSEPEPTAETETATEPETAPAPKSQSIVVRQDEEIVAATAPPLVKAPARKPTPKAKAGAKKATKPRAKKPRAKKKA